MPDAFAVHDAADRPRHASKRGHDAARPFIDNETIDRVVAEARCGRGAVAALPVVDTLKEVDESGRVTRTLVMLGSTGIASGWPGAS